MASFKSFLLSGGGSAKSSKPYPDTFKSKDTVELILGLGEGPWWGPSEGAKSIYFDQTPIVNPNGMSNFKNVNLRFYPGSELGEEIKPMLGGFSSPVSVQTALTKNVAVTRSTVQQNIDFVEIRFLVQALYKNDQKKGALPTTASIKVEYKQSSSPTWENAFLLTEPSPAGATGPEGAEASYTVYDPNDVTDAVGNVLVDPIEPGAPVNPRTVWVDSSDNNRPYTYDFANDQWVTDGAFNTGSQSWTFTSPFGYQATNSVFNGFSIENTARSIAAPRVGDVIITPSSHAVYNGSSWSQPAARPVGSNGVITVNEKISSGTIKEIRFPVPNVLDTIDIRVTQLTDDTSEARVSEIVYESFSEVKANPMTFPGTACLQVVAQASDQFSSQPTIQGVYKGSIVKVPTNYDPVARTYTGVWDGTFKMAWTNNPAWLFMEAVENTRWGLSRIFPHTCDKWSVYDWAVYCDAMVPDDHGGTRPRWTFNQWQTESKSAKEFVQLIAGAGNARFYDDGNGFVRIIFDNPNDTPVSLFCNENVEDGLFNYSYTDRQTRANRVQVWFKNKDLFYRRDSRVVQDLEDQEAYGIIPTDFVAEGCRNESEALARARSRLITNLTETEFVSFRTNRKGWYVNPWSIILIADANAGYGISGRVLERVDARNVKLDEDISIEAGVTYTISFEVLDENYPATSNSPFKLVEYTITNTAGVYSTVTVDADLPALPELCPFAIGCPEELGVPKPYRVMKIEADEADPDKISIEALQINRAKYPFIDGVGTAIESPRYTTFYRGIVEPVTNLRLRLLTDTRITTSSLTAMLEWSAPDTRFISRYKVYMGVDGGPMQLLGETASLSYEVPHLAMGDYTFSVVAVDIKGIESQPSVVTHDVIGEVRVLDAVENLRLVGGGTTTTSISPKIRWDAPAPDPAFSHYLVEVYAADGTTLKRSVTTTDVTQWTYRYEDHVADGLSRTMIFKVYVVDTAGNISVPETLTITNPQIAASNPTVTATLDGIEIEWSVPTDGDYKGTKVYVSNTDGFTPGAGNLKFDGNGARCRIPITTPATYYVRISHYDEFSAADAVLSDQGSASVNDVFSAYRLIAQQAIDDAQAAADSALARLDPIDGNGGRLDTLEEDLSTETQARIDAITGIQTQYDDLSSDFVDYQSVVSGQFSTQGSSITALTSRVGETEAATSIFMDTFTDGVNPYARINLVAAASGGNPAQIELLSGDGGGQIILTGNTIIDGSVMASGSIYGTSIATNQLTAAHLSANFGTFENYLRVGTDGSGTDATFIAGNGYDSEYRIWSGDEIAANAPFRVTKDGGLIAEDLKIIKGGELVYSSDAGFTDFGRNLILINSGTLVNPLVEVLDDNTDFIPVTLTETTAVSYKVSVPAKTIRKYYSHGSAIPSSGAPAQIVVTVQRAPAAGSYSNILSVTLLNNTHYEVVMTNSKAPELLIAGEGGDPDIWSQGWVEYTLRGKGNYKNSSSGTTYPYNESFSNTTTIGGGSESLEFRVNLNVSSSSSFETGIESGPRSLTMEDTSPGIGFIRDDTGGSSGSAIDATTVQGYAPSGYNVFTGGALVSRHPSGYIFSNYYNMTASTETVVPSRVAIEKNSDGYLRWQTWSQFVDNLEAAGLGGGGSFNTASNYSVTGSWDFSGGSIEVGHDLTFENGRHRISINDGGGNVQWRIGHDYGDTNSGEYTSTETGYAGVIKFTQSTGAFDIGPQSATSVTAGDTFSADNNSILSIAPGALSFGGNTVFHAGNLGDAPFIRPDVGTSGNLTFSPGHGLGIRFWTSDAYSIYMASAGYAGLGERAPGETTADYNMYFKMSGGTNRGFVFVNGSTAVAGIDATGTGYFAGDLVPGTNNTGNVGTSALTWANGRFTNLTIDGTLAVRGAVDLADGDFVRFGSGDDYRMWFSGSHMYMDMEVSNAYLYMRNVANTAVLSFNYASGTLSVTGNLGINSDRRLKKRIRPLKGALALVRKLRAVRHGWRKGRGNGRKEDIGFIAQEVQEVLPEIVIDEDEFLSVDYAKIAPVLLAAIQELANKVDELEAEVKDLRDGTA